MSSSPGNAPAPAAPLQAAERAIARLRVRLGVLLAVRSALRGITVLLAAWGVLLLAWRAGAGAAGPGLASGAAATAVVALVAGFDGWRRRPAAARVRARLDELAGGGGLVLAAAESDVEAWRERLPVPARARLRWRGGSTLLAAGGAALFALAAARVPIAVNAAPALDLSRPASDLGERAALLEELALVDEEAADRWREQLGEAGDLAAAGEAERAWQALDAVADELAEASAAAADAALAAGDRLSRAAEALAPGEGSGGQQATLTAAELELSGLEGSGAEPGAGSSGERGATGGVPGAAGQLDEASRAALAARLRSQAASRQQLADALRRGSAADLEALRKAAAGGIDERALAEHLFGRALQGTAPRQARGGRGGVDRGRGDAPFLVKEASHDYGIDFTDQALPPATLAALDSSVVLATDAARPEADGAAASPAGSLDRAAADSGAAYTQLVLPRHRAAVRRYFARPQ
jgi:hypothetical protein